MLFFSEAGRGGCFFFPRRDGVGWLFFFFSTGRDRAVFFFFRGPGRHGGFWRWQFFWRNGAKSLHRPAKGGLNRPASRPCKALFFFLFFVVFCFYPVFGWLVRNPTKSSRHSRGAWRYCLGHRVLSCMTCVVIIIIIILFFLPSHSSKVLRGDGLVGGNPTMNTPRLRRGGG